MVEETEDERLALEEMLRPYRQGPEIPVSTSVTPTDTDQQNRAAAVPQVNGSWSSAARNNSAGNSPLLRRTRQRQDSDSESDLGSDSGLPATKRSR